MCDVVLGNIDTVGVWQMHVRGGVRRGETSILLVLTGHALSGCAGMLANARSRN